MFNVGSFGAWPSCHFSANVALFSQLNQSDCCEKEDDDGAAWERVKKKFLVIWTIETEQSWLDHDFQNETTHTCILSTIKFINLCEGVKSVTTPPLSNSEGEWNVDRIPLIIKKGQHTRTGGV